MEKDKKKQLIRAAVKRFEKHGIKKTTLDEIARDLRISKASIYHYFNSKEELYHSTLEWESMQFIDELNNINSTLELTAIGFINKYLEFKESLNQKYFLIYRVVLSILQEENFEKEDIFINNFLKSEEETLAKLLATFNVNKKDFPESFSSFLVKQSWGSLLANKLYNKSKPEENLKKKEMFIQLIESILI